MFYHAMHVVQSTVFLSQVIRLSVYLSALRNSGLGYFLFRNVTLKSLKG